LINRKEASGGSGVEVTVGVKVAVAVRVGEGPRLGVNCLVGQAVSVALSVAVALSEGGSDVCRAGSVSICALTNADGMGRGVAETVDVFCGIVVERIRGVVPGTLSAWQLARPISRPIPAEISRIVLLIELPVDWRGVIGDFALTINLKSILKLL
jgi:hypothetical protein